MARCQACEQARIAVPGRKGGAAYQQAYASRHDRETLLHLDGVMLALRLFPGHQPWNTRHFLPGIGHGLQAAILRMRATGLNGHHETLPRSVLPIGRASCRERVCEYV